MKNLTVTQKIALTVVTAVFLTAMILAKIGLVGFDLTQLSN